MVLGPATAEERDESLVWSGLVRWGAGGMTMFVCLAIHIARFTTPIRLPLGVCGDSTPTHCPLRTCNDLSTGVPGPTTTAAFGPHRARVPRLDPC